MVHPAQDRLVHCRYMQHHPKIHWFPNLHEFLVKFRPYSAISGMYIASVEEGKMNEKLT